MKKGIIISLLLYMLFVTSIYDVDADNVAFDRHVSGYERVLKEAENNPYYKYGIYSSRIIAVKNPEVYLQGDIMFAKYITSQSGYAKAYQEKVQSMYFEFFAQRSLHDDPFSFKQIDLSCYQIRSTVEMFGSEAPLFDYIDVRLSPIHTTLKVKTITSLEGANLVYVKKRMEGSPQNDTFLIFTKDKTGYVWSKDKFFNAIGKEVMRKAIADPILIFNEQSVWYPLMGRDDTGKDVKLNDIVKKIATVNNIPVLSPIEKELAKRLQVASTLNSFESRNLASLYSIHFDGLKIGSNIEMYKQLKVALPDIYYPKINIFINAFIMKIGNYLSPRTAYLSSLITEDVLGSLKKIEKVNLNQLATEKIFPNGRREFSAWGHTWPCSLIENNIDDSFRTKGGHCVSQAINTSAILDLVGVEHIYINFLANYGKYIHSIVIIPQYNTSFSNGLLTALDSYKKYKDLEIEAAIMNDRLVVFGDDRVYVNGSVQEGYDFHQKIAIVANKFFGYQSILKVKEILDDFSVLRYKSMKMPN